MNCENSYSKFADLYDRLMSDVDYKERADYICQLLDSCNIKPNGKSLYNPESHPIIADLGCGTGTITIDLAERGFEMIGIDISPEMLSQAMDKSIASGKRPLFLNQDMTCFELYGTVDAVLCSLDGINHVTDENTLMEMFKCVENYLNPGGCFIFDINTEYKLKNVIGNNIFYEVYDDVVYLWQNELNERKKIVDFDLTFFFRNDSGLYERFDTTFSERIYSVSELSGFLAKANLKVMNIYGDMSFDAPGDKENRVFFIALKI